MITLEVNGTPFTQFDDISVALSLEEVSGSFNFTAFTDGTVAFPISKGDSCRVLVDDTPVITGFIEVVMVDYDDSSHAISIAGRDKTSDVIDSTVGDDFEFNTPITLKNLIEQVLVKAGIPAIKVIDNVGNLKPFSETEKISADVGSSLFDYIEGYCRKRQVLITSNGDGDLVITRGEGGSTEFSLFNHPDTQAENNIISANVRYNDTDRYNTYIVKSQGNPSALLLPGIIPTTTVVNHAGQARDTAIRPSRRLYLIAEKSSNSEQCQERAVWESNIKRSRAFEYSATVQGHSDPNTGQVWAFNNLVNVLDNYAGLSGKFLINGVTYTTTINGGSVTTLDIVAKDAYTIAASEPVADSTSKKGLL